MATVTTEPTPSAVPTVAVPEAAMPFPIHWSLADLQDHLGVPPERIRAYPPPGLATEADLVVALERDHCLCELIDGVLVEKTVGQYESSVSFWLIHFLSNYLAQHPVGQGFAPDAPERVSPNQIRMPDASVVRADRLTATARAEKVLPMAPDLAIEVLSASNTPKEMRRKLRDYFAGGTRLIWYIDPETRTAKVYTSPRNVTLVPSDGILDGGDVLPGFKLALTELFAKVGPQA